MKRPIFTLKNILVNLPDYLRKTSRAFSVVITLTFIYNLANAQNCNVILACNDGVQISLDSDCAMNIEPDMVLEGPVYDDTYYDVEAKLSDGTLLTQATVGTDGQGRPIKWATINASHIGKTLYVRVSLRGCGNSCWGTATIEDKLKPQISTCPCEERITEFEGTIMGSGPTYNRPLASQCDGGGSGFQTSDYTIFQFAVSATSVVDINLGQTNAVFNLYQNSFDPANPCVNRISLNTRNYSGSLNAGTPYYIVVSSNSDLPSGTNIAITSLFIDSRTSDIKSSTTATVCMYSCNEEASLLAQTATNATNRPVFIDACSANLTYTKRDSVILQMCAMRYGKIIKRTWTAKDPSGNVSDEKTQYLYIKRGSLADVVCPADWIRDCTVSFAKLENGAPDPSVSGRPTNIACSNIQLYHVDVVFDICGAGIKVARQWNIIDWCTGETKICMQTIKVEDNIRPVVTCPADLTTQSGSTITPADIVTVSADGCTANWDVKPPIAVNDCSKVTWEVAFKKADSNGNPPANTPFTKSDGATLVVGTRPAFATTISQSARPYRITNLPLGRTWLKYTVIDECGNSTDCFTELDVVDKTPPTAICEDETVISLDDSGWAELFAESLDDHSLDNCGPITKYEIRRKTTTCAGKSSDLNFGTKVSFCCSDVTSPASYVDVVLRVYDAAGNYNECETKVKVQNKRAPSISCPGSKTLTCGDSRIAAWVSGTATFDTSFFGKPTATGICSDLKFGSRITSNNIDSKCGTGSVVREWFLISNPSVKCTQSLTVTSPAFSSSNVTFPGDLSLPTCDIDKAHPDITNSRPSVNNTTCRDIGVSFVDQEFYYVPEACIKILRTWKVIDWCSYPNAQVVAEKVQTIKLTGSGGPVVTCGPNQTLDTDPGKCDREVTMTANATDECTDPEDLKYSWSLDLGRNNTVDQTGTGKSVTRTLPAGPHRITFTVTNRCGTPKSCSYDITIRPTKKPTPICIGEVVWVIGSTGSTEVWASDFNLKSENNCGDDSKLKFSFNAAGTQPARTFTCADIPNGQLARIPLKMYVIDENGNSDFCDVVLILQDSPLTNACTDRPEMMPAVSGRITTTADEGVDHIEVGLTLNSSTTEMKDMTKNHGEYKFSGVDVFDPKSVAAAKNDDVLNGVSTLDLVLIQRHILGIQKLDDPYKLLAADVNNSRSITASDLVNLRKLILGITNEFENNTSWRFVPKAYTFDDPEFPFDFPSKIGIDTLFEDKGGVDFIAVKTGDVNNSMQANANSPSTERRSGHAVLIADDKEFDAGKLLKFEVRAGDNMEITGTQFGLNFNAGLLEFSGIKPGVFDLKSANYNAYNAHNGIITFSYDVAQGVEVSADDVLFTVEFRTLSAGNTSSISLSTEGVRAELYDREAAVRQLALQYRDKGAVAARNILYQNQPNPFKDATNISFELAATSDVTIRIMDVTGKAVFVQKGRFEKGYNTVTISNSSLHNSGVYYYQLEAGSFSATRKMILIE